MRIFKKIVSVVLSAAMAVGAFAVSASAVTNGNQCTYEESNQKVVFKMTAVVNGEEYDWNDTIPCNPGDTLEIYYYVNTDFLTKSVNVPIYYSAPLLDPKDVGTGTTLLKSQRLVILNPDVEWNDYLSNSTTGRTYWSFNVQQDSRWPMLEDGTTPPDKENWHQFLFIAYPDPSICEPDGAVAITEDTWLFHFPLYVSSDTSVATPGTTYQVKMDQRSQRTKVYKTGPTFVNEAIDGNIVDMMPGYTDLQYFDMEKAHLTFVVAGETEELSYDALQTEYDAVKDTVVANYTTETATPFSTALANAAAMLDSKDAADQDAIDALTTALTDAYAALVEADASYTDLDAAITLAGTKTQSDYTPASWSAMQTKLTAANAVSRDLKVKDQATIDAAATALSDAIDALVPYGAASYTALDAAIADAGTKTQANYTTDSWTAMQTALTAANAVDRGLNAGQQSVVDAATTALTNAIAALVEADADYTDLDAAITLAGTKTQSDYTPASWSAMQTKLTAANAVSRDLKVKDQATIDAAATALSDAIEALVPYGAANYSALNTAINTANTKIASWYTTDSWSAMQTALTAANAVDKNLNAGQQSIVDAATTALNDAITALVEADADYTDLDAAVLLAGTKTQADYTPASWAAMQAKLTAANAVSDTLKAKDQDLIDTAATALSDAIEALVPYGAADYTALDAAIADAGTKTQANYTTDSWAAMQTALTAANAVDRGLNAGQQSTVNAATTALTNAIAALVEADADYTELDAAIALAGTKTQADYTPTSWGVMQSKLLAANNVARTLKVKDQATIDAAATALNDAITALEYKGADYDAFDASLTTAKNKVLQSTQRDQYTAESLAALDAAIAAGNNLSRTLTVVDQAEVDAAKTALDEAVAGLEYSPFDYTTINTYVGYYNDLVADKDNYTPESWNLFEGYVNQVEEGWTNESIEYSQHMLLQSRMKRAYEALALADGADYSDVDAAIEEADALTEANYTPESWADLQDAIDAVVRGLNANSQSDVDDMATAIYDAIDALVEADADYTDLDAAIALAGTKTQADYTPASWSAMQTKLTAANNVARDLKVKDQATIDAAATALSDAIEALELAEADADYSALTAALADAATYNQNNYTSESWADLVAAVADGEAVPAGLKEADQATIDDAAAAINAAIEALVEKEVKSAITAITYSSNGTKATDFVVTVTGRPSKIKFASPGGATMTFDRKAENVSILSYDAGGNIVNDLSRDLAYEVWTIDAQVSDKSDLTAYAKFDYTWETEGFGLVIDLPAPVKDYEYYGAEATASETAGKTTITITTGLDIAKTRIVYPSGATSTLAAATYATKADGKLVYTFDATAKAGDVLKIQTKQGTAWVDAGEVTA